ncbi:hypothetical protein AWC38_SpisGene5450 [Stylophora pistillata]|uniref:FLYWCH-type domain-containing protein n=1 Tax=Stylophora pistillata TaxID=50429 RepID=A0A2B4SMK7_STYPI|nr:hypothetical protein AWC38_SpisGene5450 [Stylophora pistillata]
MGGRACNLPALYNSVESQSNFNLQLVETVVAKQLQHYLNGNNLFPVFQSAYRQNHSTETALLKVTNDILLNMNNQCVTLLILLDLSAAFDTINHDTMLRRLEYSFGIQGKAFSCFASCLSGRTQRIMIKESLSKPIVHDPNDTAKLAVVRNMEDCMRDICSWMLNNDLHFNDDKNEFLLIGSSQQLRKLDNISICVGDSDIHPVPLGRSLGCWFDSRLSTASHITKICTSSFYFIHNIRRIREYLSRQSSEILVHAFITSSLDNYVQETKDLSQVLCQKCTVLKYYKLLQQLQELERLRLDYKESVCESIDIQRDKRCAKDSPVDNHDIKNARGKACIFPAAPKSKRKLCVQNNNDIEDPFSALDVDYFCDSRDRKRSHEQRCPQVSAIAYRFALAVLWHSGAKKQGFMHACHWGISVSHSSILWKLDEMGEEFDSEVKTWKWNLEKHHQTTKMLDCIEQYVAAQEVQQQEQIPVGFSTTNIDALELEFPNLMKSVDQCSEDGSDSSASEVENMDDFVEDYEHYCESSTRMGENYCLVSQHLKKSGFGEEDIKTLTELSSMGRSSPIGKVHHAIIKAHHLRDEPPKYQIIGDNLDIAVRGEIEIQCSCETCNVPEAESTRISAADEVASVSSNSSQDFGTFTVSTPVEELSLQEAFPVPMELDDTMPPKTYERVPAFSQCGKPKLADSDGYMYTVKSVKGDCTYWRCSVRNKTSNCKATLQERDDNFIPGPQPHCHQPAGPGAATALKVSAGIRKTAIDKLFTPAGTVLGAGSEGESEPVQTSSKVAKKRRLESVSSSKMSNCPEREGVTQLLARAKQLNIESDEESIRSSILNSVESSLHEQKQSDVEVVDTEREKRKEKELRRKEKEEEDRRREEENRRRDEETSNRRRKRKHDELRDEKRTRSGNEEQTQRRRRAGSRRLCVFLEMMAECVVSASLSNVGGLAVGAIDLINRTLSVPRFILVFNIVKLLSCSDADCAVEAILLLMLSLVGSDSCCCRDRAASTLDTIPSQSCQFLLRSSMVGMFRCLVGWFVGNYHNSVNVEAALSLQQQLSEPTKDSIRSRIASTAQSASLHDSNLTKEKRHALKWLRNDENIVILPDYKGRVTVVMDKTDYHNKMDALVNKKQAYKELKRDPTPALQCKLNSKLLTLRRRTPPTPNSTID